MNTGIKVTLYLIDFAVNARNSGAMARMARAVAPGVALHVTLKGNRRQKVFFEDADYARYSELLTESE